MGSPPLVYATKTVIYLKYKLLPEGRGGTLPYTVPLAGFFVYHSLFVIVTRCLSLELLTTKHLSLRNISHIIHIIYDPQTTYTLKMFEYHDPHIAILRHLLENICESSSTFKLASQGDCRYFVCVIFKRFTFSCSKNDGPAGRPARGETIDLDTVTLLPNKPSCAQSFWHP